MDEEMIEKQRRELLEEQERQRKEDRNEKIRAAINIVIILLVVAAILFIVFSWIIPYMKQRALDKAAAEEARIAAEEEANRIAVEIEQEKIENETENLLEELKMKKDYLKTFCTPLFDKRMQNYNKYFFDTIADTKVWLEKETKIRLDKSKSFDERVPYQIRHAFINTELSMVLNVPLAVGVGEITSDNFNESVGMLCNSEGVIEITGDARDNLLYQTTMRREWV